MSEKEEKAPGSVGGTVTTSTNNSSLPNYKKLSVAEQEDRNSEKKQGYRERFSIPDFSIGHQVKKFSIHDLCLGENCREVNHEEDTSSYGKEKQSNEESQKDEKTFVQDREIDEATKNVVLDSLTPEEVISLFSKHILYNSEKVYIKGKWLINNILTNHLILLDTTEGVVKNYYTTKIGVWHELYEIEHILSSNNIVKALALLFLKEHKVVYPNFLKKIYEISPEGVNVAVVSFIYALENLRKKGIIERIPQKSTKFRDRRESLDISKSKQKDWYCLAENTDFLIEINETRLRALLPESVAKRIYDQDPRTTMSKTHEGNIQEQEREFAKINYEIEQIHAEIETLRGKEDYQFVDFPADFSKDLNDRCKRENLQPYPENRLKMAKQLRAEIEDRRMQ